MTCKRSVRHPPPAYRPRRRTKTYPNQPGRNGYEPHTGNSNIKYQI